MTKRDRAAVGRGGAERALGGAAASGAGARIAEAFEGHGRQAALMPYVMAGFPDPETSLRAARACADAGADVLELGVPFSDPLADGPVIHAAASKALSGGVTVDQVLEVCSGVAKRLPVVLMVYVNTVLARGADRFCRSAADAGACGLILPDLPHDESEGMRSACHAAGLALVPLASPNASDERLRSIGADARGFVYTVSMAGTTGERDALPPGLATTVERVRAAASVPVAVGFGISTGEQARRVAEVADGVIVGTRIVRAAGEGGAAAVGEVVAGLDAALR